MKRNTTIWAAAGSALGLMLMSGCTGPSGPQGPMGANGATGAQGEAGAIGATGEQGPGGAAGTLGDGGVSIPVSCLSPCHGFNGVVGQYRSSIHYTAYVVNVGGTEAATWTTNGQPCGNCHAIDALEQRAAGDVGSGNGTVANLASGELQYMDPDAGKPNYATYTGSATVAQVYCTTCHEVTNTNDPHKTGAVWTPGSFPLVVSADGGPLFLEKSPEAGAVVGSNAGNYGPGNTCMWCHRSRVDVTNYITASNKVTSTHWGPHEGPQADIFTGAGGYQFPGKSYGTSTHQQKLSCVDCHMPNLAENANVPDHSFNPNLLACGASACHSPAPTNFDVAGGQSTVAGAMIELERALNNIGALTRASAAPYTPLTDPDGGGGQVGDQAFSTDLTTPGVTLTAAQAGALYNYVLIARGGALGVHNPKYVKQLIFDSFQALTGGAPLSLPVRPQ